MSKQDRIDKSKKRANFTDKFKRKEETIQTLKSFLIVTEGKTTEVNYFESFPLYEEPEIKSVVLGTGTNTLSLVEKAEEIVEDFRQKNKCFDENWVVFDKDSFPDSNFDNAIKSAESKGFNVAFSNECFELWYVLHYQDMTTPLLRENYFKILSKHLGYTYSKNSLDMYDLLLPYQPTAIKRAEKLKEHCKDIPVDHDKNPLTMVVNLVTELNKNTKSRYNIDA